MPNVDRIESLADVPALETEFKVIIGNLKSVKKGIADLGNIESLARSAKSMKELRDVTDQLNKSKAQTVIVEKRLAEVQDAKGNALKKIQLKEYNDQLKLQAQLENSVAGSVEHAALMVKSLNYQLSILNVTTDAGKKKQDELNQSLAKYQLFISNNKAGATPAAPGVPKLSDRPIESIPFEIGGNTDKINQAETAVSDLERSEAEAVMTANEWAAAQKKGMDSLEDDKIKSASQQMAVYSDELEKLTGTLAENEELMAIYKKELAQIDLELKTLDKTTSTAEKNTDAYRAKVANLTSTQSKLKGEVKDLDKTIKNQTIDQNAAAGSIDKLRARYALLLREIERGGSTFKKSAVGKQILQEAKDVKTALDKSEREALLFRGSLSNTGSAITGFFSKAFTGLRNLAAFIPGIGLAGLISVIADTVIEFTASLFDNEKSIKQVSAAQKELAEQAKETNEVIQQQIDLLSDGYGSGVELLKSQLALLEKSGASARAIYGKKLELIKAENEEAEKGLNLQIKRAEHDVDNYEEGRTGYDALAAAIEKYRSALEGEYDVLKKLEDQKVDIRRLGGSKGDTEDVQSQIDATKARIDTYKTVYDDYYNASKNAFDKQNALDETQAEQSNKIAEQRKKDILELIKYQEQLNIAKKKELIDSEVGGTRTEKIILAKEVGEAEKKIQDAQYAYDLANLKKETLSKENFNKEKLLLDEKYSEDRYQIERRTTNQITDIQLSYRAKFLKFLEDTKAEADRQSEELHAKEEARIKARVDAVETNLKQRLDIIDISNNIELAKLTDLYNKRKITTEKFRQGELKITRKTLLEGLEAQVSHDIQLLSATKEDADERNKALDEFGNVILKNQKKNIGKRLEAELDYYENLIHASNITGQALIDAEKKIADIRLKIKKQQTADADETTTEILKGIDTIKEAYNDVAGLIGGILDAQATKKKNAIQAQIDDIERVAQAEIDAVDRSVLSAQDKADKIAAIEAKAAAQKAVLEQKQRQIDRRKAIFEKANAITQIILGTATSVASAKTLFEKIAFAALGAAQLAIAIATPIPQYKHGTGDDVHPGGKAIVGDGGKHEAIIYPDGTVMKSPNVATVIDLPEGTIVEPDFDKTMMRLAMTEAPEHMNPVQYVGVDNTPAIERMEKNVVMAIKSKPVLNLEASEGGMAAMWKHLASKVKYINDQTNWK